MVQLKELYEPDGMSMLPVFDDAGHPTSEFAVFEILERYEERVEDHSHLRWFPHISTYQRVLIQEWRGLTPDQLALCGEPREEWILIHGEALPFIPSGPSSQ